MTYRGVDDRRASEYSAFSSRCIAIMQATGTSGMIHIVARSAGLKTGELDVASV